MSKVPVPLSVDLTASWVLDKVWVTARWSFSDGRIVESPPSVLEWPVQPTDGSEWRDVLREACEGHLLPVGLLDV